MMAREDLVEEEEEESSEFSLFLAHKSEFWKLLDICNNGALVKRRDFNHIVEY